MRTSVRSDSRRSRLAVTLAFTSTLALTGALTVACGGAPTPPAGPSVSAGPATPAAPSAPDLQAQFAAALRGPQPGDAVVTYAVFAPGTPEKRALTKLTAAVGAAFRSPPPELAEAARRATSGGLGADALDVSLAPVDAELPLNVAVIAEAAGPLGPGIAGAGQVAFVRYAGAPRAAHGQISGAALAAVTVARALEAPAIVDLSTLEALPVDAFVAAATPAPDLRTHVRVLPVEGEDGRLTVKTRGLARFGKPDLEGPPVAPAELQTAGARFMQVLEGVWTAPGPVGPGFVAAGTALAPCASPPETWDHECVSYTK